MRICENLSVNLGKFEKNRKWNCWCLYHIFPNVYLIKTQILKLTFRHVLNTLSKSKIPSHKTSIEISDPRYDSAPNTQGLIFPTTFPVGSNDCVCRSDTYLNTHSGFPDPVQNSDIAATWATLSRTPGPPGPLDTFRWSLVTVFVGTTSSYRNDSEWCSTSSAINRNIKWNCYFYRASLGGLHPGASNVYIQARRTSKLLLP